MTVFGTARAGAGEWIGVLGERTAVVLPPQSAGVAARVWVALDAGDGFDGALDAVLREGLQRTPSFVLAEAVGAGTLRLLVRGTPHVRAHRADGTTRVIDSGAGTWSDEVVDDVVGLEIDPGAGAWADVPFTSGLRRLGALAWGSASLDSPVLDAPAVPPLVRPAAPPAVPAAVIPDVRDESDDAALADETAPLAALPLLARESAHAPDLLPAAPPAPPVEPAEAVTDVIRAVPAAPTTVQPVARVTFSHGLVMALDAPCVVGRAPAAAASAFADARTVTVPSPLGEISGSHLELFPGTGAQAGQVLVVDLGSTNGTVVRRADRPPVELVPGAPWVLEPDATVDLGDGATLRVAPL